MAQPLTTLTAPSDKPCSKGRPRFPVLVLQFAPVACVLAALPFRLFDLDRHSVPKELVVHLAALLSALPCLWAARRLALSRLDALIAAYLLAAACSAGLATNPWLSFRTTALLFSGAALFWAAGCVSSRGQGHSLVIALAFATALAALTGLAQAYGWESEWTALSRAPGGTFGNRNFMAHLLAVGTPFVLLAAVRARTRSGFWLCFAGLGLVTAALTLSRSRAAWIGLCVALLSAALASVVSGGGLRRLPFGKRGALLALAAALGVAAAAALPNQLEWRSRSPYLDTLRHVADYQTGSGKGRLIQYRNTFRLAADQFLLGVGPGNWPVEYSRYRTRGDPSLRPGGQTSNPWPSSDWVALLAEQGLLGSVLFALTLLGLLRRAWGLLERGDGAEGLAALSMLVCAGVTGGFDVVLHMPTPALFFWAGAGALLPPGERRWVSAFERLPVRAAVLGAVALLGALAVFRSASQTVAMGLVSSGRGIDDLETASRLDPGSYRIHMLTAEAWLRRGRYDLGRAHAEAAADLFPYLPESRSLAGRSRRPGQSRP